MLVQEFYRLKALITLNLEQVNTTESGLSLRFQVAGYLLLVAGEVASSPRDPPLPYKKFLQRNFYCFLKRITAPKRQSSSRVQLSLIAVL